MKFKERTCAICGKGGSTTPVTALLQAFGIKGSYAHLPCIRRLQREHQEAVKRSTMCRMPEAKK